MIHVRIDHKQVVRFKYPYTKLSRRFFTTVRGSSWYKRMRIDTSYTILVPMLKVNDVAKCVHKRIWRLVDLPLGMMQHDVAPLKCESKQDYIDILNTLVPIYFRYSEDSPVTVLVFDWQYVPKKLRVLLDGT
jgi:hypothetical protein